MFSFRNQTPVLYTKRSCLCVSEQKCLLLKLMMCIKGTIVTRDVDPTIVHFRDITDSVQGLVRRVVSSV